MTFKDLLNQLFCRSNLVLETVNTDYLYFHMLRITATLSHSHVSLEGHPPIACFFTSGNHDSSGLKTFWKYTIQQLCSWYSHFVLWYIHGSLLEKAVSQQDISLYTTLFLLPTLVTLAAGAFHYHMNISNLTQEETLTQLHLQKSVCMVSLSCFKEVERRFVLSRHCVNIAKITSLNQQHLSVFSYYLVVLAEISTMYLI